MAPDASLISVSSAVAASFQASIDFREPSKAVRAATSSSILVTVDLNLPVTSSLASTALISLGQECLFSGCTSLDDFQLGCNVFLKVHGPGNSVLREHGSGCFLDICKFSSGS